MIASEIIQGLWSIIMKIIMIIMIMKFPLKDKKKINVGEKERARSSPLMQTDFNKYEKAVNCWLQEGIRTVKILMGALKVPIQTIWKLLRYVSLLKQCLLRELAVMICFWGGLNRWYGHWNESDSQMAWNNQTDTRTPRWFPVLSSSRLRAEPNAVSPRTRQYQLIKPQNITNTSHTQDMMLHESRRTPGCFFFYIFFLFFSPHYQPSHTKTNVWHEYLASVTLHKCYISVNRFLHERIRTLPYMALDI